MKKTADKTIFVSMGTVNKNAEFYRNCIAAFRGTSYQVIISLGTNQDLFDDAPENIQIYDRVDQMAALSITDVFITHCGMNSVSEGLYFEVPLLLFPQTPEQGAVAERTIKLGAGQKLRSMDPATILHQTEHLLADSSYKSSASEISKSFQACGGAKEALEFLQKVCMN